MNHEANSCLIGNYVHAQWIWALVFNPQPLGMRLLGIGTPNFPIDFDTGNGIQLVYVGSVVTPHRLMTQEGFLTQ